MKYFKSLFLKTCLNIDTKAKNKTRILINNWKLFTIFGHNMSYPSTSFSGCTLSVILRASISVSASSGICTIIPCIDESLFN